MLRYVGVCRCLSPREWATSLQLCKALEETGKLAIEVGEPIPVKQDQGKSRYAVGLLGTLWYTVVGALMVRSILFERLNTAQQT